MEHFGEFIENEAILPDHFFSSFELKRLSVTYYGALKDMNPNK